MFPANLDSLSIGDAAFLAQPSRTDVVLFFPFVEAPSAVTLGVWVTQVVPLWVWLGADGALTSDARDGDPAGWGTTESYELHGARTASFEANGGEGLGSLYVFPEVGGVSQFAPLDGVGGLDPAGFLGSEPLAYSVTLPGTSWPVEGQGSFSGWCADSWVGGECSSGALAAGLSASLTEGATEFSAGWEATPAEPTVVKATECGVYDTVSVPEDVPGLYSYSVEGEAPDVTVRAVPAGGFVSLEGPAEWSFELGMEPCPVVVTPEAPTVEFAAECGVQGTVVLPDQEGVEYTVGPVVDGKVTVTATALEGYVLAEGATSSWVLEVAGEDCPPVVFTVRFELNAGSGDFAEMTVVEGGAVTLPSAVPTREGYTFKGWLVTDLGRSAVLLQPGESFTPAGDVTLVAQWEKDAVEPEKPEPEKPGTVKPGTGGSGTGGSVGELPVTGGQAAEMAALGLAFLVGGAVVVAGSRGRRAGR